MSELESLQQQLAALNAARASDVLSVRYGNGEQVTYRSVDEMMKQVNFITRRLNELRRVQSGKPRHGISAARFINR